ncbi:MAG: DNA-directed DNA polymerase II small subunit [Candidatus Micrarchaeia archaeon]
MQEKQLLDLLSEREFLVEPRALQSLCSLPDDEAVASLDAAFALLAEGNGFVLTGKILDSVFERLAADRKVDQAPAIKRDFDAAARLWLPKLSFSEENDVSGKSTCTGVIEDFVGCFNDRFKREKEFLRLRSSVRPFATASRVKSAQDREKYRVIGMISSKRTTKNGHLLVELEDDTGVIPCLFSKNDAATLAIGSELLLDEVIAVDGLVSKGLFIADAVTWPELPYRERPEIESDACIAFISDMHIGSKHFLGDEFNAFLRFLNGEGPEEALAGRIKYLLVAGDVTDGIGVYPSQEDDLVTKDIYEQYEVFANLMSAVPDWIEVVIGPGNHDAVRGAEPQPRLSEEFTYGLEKKKNFHFVGNPATFTIEGLKVLMYHGSSMGTLISSLPSLRSGYLNPETVGIEMLKRRHLCPVYGQLPVVPEKRDYLVIDEVPDIFHFGHVHKNGYANYRGTTIINSGAWQATTDYQVRLGHLPSPCQLPIYEVRTGTYKVLNFK